MPNPDRCRERAQECRRKAKILSDPRDRSRWLKLAEEWTTLSRIPFQSDAVADQKRVPQQTGLWRGELPTRRVISFVG